MKKISLFDMQTRMWHLKTFPKEPERDVTGGKENGGRQALPSFRSLETLELLWELHFRLRVIISRRQTAALSAQSFQQLANPDNIMEYMLLALMLHCLGC